MLWIIVNGGKVFGATEAVTVMTRAEYELYVSDTFHPRFFPLFFYVKTD